MRWFLGNTLRRFAQRMNVGTSSVYVFTLARQSVMVPKVIGTDKGHREHLLHLEYVDCDDVSGGC